MSQLEAHHLSKIRNLRKFDGSPKEFWSSLLKVVSEVTGATASDLFRVSDNDTSIDNWNKLATLNQGIGTLTNEWQQLASESLHSTLSAQGNNAAIAFIGAGKPQAVALLETPSPLSSTEISFFELCSDIPDSYLKHSEIQKSLQKQGQLATVIDLTLALQKTSHFQETALKLCDLINTRFQADRTLFGWMEGRSISLQAMSHSDKLEMRSELVRNVESMMDEAIDQDNEISFPDDSGHITFHHSRHAQSQGSGHLISIPLRINDQPIAVISIERHEMPFNEMEISILRLIADTITPTLQESRLRSQWIGKRFVSTTKEKCAKLFETNHLKTKVISLFGAITFVCLFFVKIEYRISVPFIFKSRATAQLPAPFDGYINDVTYRVGDRVKKGTVLASLDISNLTLDEIESSAEQERFEGEALHAEQNEDPGSMQIASLQALRAKTRAAIIRLQIEQASISAPFDGFVIEGDLTERISSPVKRGEILIKMAQIDGLYAELKVPESDIAYIHESASCQLALTSLPEQKFEGVLDQMDPVAADSSKGTVFSFRTSITDQPEPWWRPGMSGVCKIDAGRKSIFWILTRRTADFLRITFWI